MTRIYLTLLSILISVSLAGQQKTYCNPLNLDYAYTPFEQFSDQGKHRATADPVIVNFRDTLFLFSTNQEGYWYSDDMLSWKFVYRKFLRDDKYIHDLNAPAVWAMEDTLYVYGSTWELDFPVWKSTDPVNNRWEIAADTLNVGAWDPAFLYEQDSKKLYLYWGSSNEYPLLATEIRIPDFKTTGITRAISRLHPEEHGWERFGEHNDNVYLAPFIEGAWVTKYEGRYYLQYSAPGTEFSGYADGVLVSNSPLEGFSYQEHNPFSYKPGGFARGAGHGATFSDKYGNYWHTATIAISVKNNFERRIGIWPAGFDSDGVMYCNTAFGDYPTLLPKYARDPEFTGELFSGWMLLNYMKPVRVSSTLGGFAANFAVDEDIRTYWSAATGDYGEWIQSDLGEIATIYAIQVNYADINSDFMGKRLGDAHKYVIYGSRDEKKWTKVVDKSKNLLDVPHDYIELESPVKYRYLKFVNQEMTSGNFALSGFRIFGKGQGEKPGKVENFLALRTPPDRGGNRLASWLKWQENMLADGYIIYFGKEPGKLYGSIMVYGANEYYFNGMDAFDSYYFQVAAFNSNGISPLSEIIKAD